MTAKQRPSASAEMAETRRDENVGDNFAAAEQARRAREEAHLTAKEGPKCICGRRRGCNCHSNADDGSE